MLPLTSPVWIAGFEDIYSISLDGEVWNHKRNHPMKSFTLKSGHKHLYLSRNGKKHSRYLHRLLYEAFGGPIPDGYEVRHLNGDPADNRLENLAVGTRSDQRYDDVRNKVHGEAKKTHCKRGHPLQKPFLDKKRLEEGSRICLPCKRAVMSKRYHGYTEEQVQTLADAHYRRLREELTTSE